MKILLVVFQKNLKILPINAKFTIFQVLSNFPFPFTLLSIWLIPRIMTLKKIKTKEPSLEINTRSDSFNQSTSFSDTLSETLPIEAVDPNNKTKPQFETNCFFCQKNNRSVSTRYRKINMLKESKPQSKSPTPSFYQHFKTPFNKYDNQIPPYRSCSNSNHYRRFSRDFCYKSRSHSLSNSRPRYYQNHSSQNHSPHNDRNRSRYDQHYKNASRSSYSSRPYKNSTSSLSPNKPYPCSRKRSPITVPLLDLINHHTALLLNHVPIAIEADLTPTRRIIQIPTSSLLSILLNNQFPIFITPPQQNLFLK